MENATFPPGHFDDIFSADESRPLPVRVIGSCFTLLLGITSCLGNSAVILAWYSDETLRNQASNFFIVYLSILDVTTGVFTIIPSGISVAFDYWPFADLFCKFQNGMGYSSSCTSCVVIALITLDRGIAVLNPLKYPRIINSSIIFSSCFIISVFFVLALAIPFCLDRDWIRYNYAEAQCGYDWSIKTVQFFIIPGTVGCFFLPVILIGICNALIISAALKQNRHRLFERRIKDGGPRNDGNMNKTILTAFVLVITFYILVSPYVLSRNVSMLFGLNTHPLLNFLFSEMMYISSAVNPFIYALLRKDFNNAFRKIPRLLSQTCFGLNRVADFY